MSAHSGNVLEMMDSHVKVKEIYRKFLLTPPLPTSLPPSLLFSYYSPSSSPFLPPSLSLLLLPAPSLSLIQLSPILSPFLPFSQLLSYSYYISPSNSYSLSLTIETGLVCQYQQCNRDGCPDPSIQYCDDQSPAIERSRQICSATYTRVGDGSFRPGLLTCFSDDHDCGTDKCVLRQLQNNGDIDIYFCCCTENLCNAQIVFPNETGALPPSGSVSAPLSSSVPTSVSVEQTEPLPPTSSIVPNGVTIGLFQYFNMFHTHTHSVTCTHT